MANVVSLLASELEELLAAIRLQAPLADLVELRLDRLGGLGERELAGLIESCERPVIATVHGAEAFGDFSGTDEERFELLRAAARAGAAFIDIDWTRARALGEVPGPCRRIVSRHETDHTPEDLAAFHAEVRAEAAEGDRLKLVTHARRVEDGLRVMNHLRENADGELVAFCSGERGWFTRIMATILGSPLTYAAPAFQGEATAPGQLRLDELHEFEPAGELGPETRILGVVGKPVRHSLSPRLHNDALRRVGFDGVYLAFEPDDFDDFLDLATDPSLAGFSVTAPFKERARARASGEDRATRLAGAANTLVRVEGGWRAHNTDVGAVRGALERGFACQADRPGGGIPPEGARVLVVGAGGAARAAALAGRERGARRRVAARRDDRAALLASELGAEHVLWSELGAADYHALVQCTPAGSPAQPGELPFDPAQLIPGTVVVESAYRPQLTPLLALGRERRCTLVPGGYWFVLQAAEQFRLFTGKQADLDRMEAVLDEETRPGGRPVVLVGLRGSGKTSVGRVLAAMLGLRFTDLDEKLAGLHTRRGAPLPAGEVLREVGEERFRDLETEALRLALDASPPGVLATGGGVLEREVNRGILAGHHCRCFWLDAAPEILASRLAADPTPRPPLTDREPLEEIRLLAARRAPLYGEVSERKLDSGGSGINQLARVIFALLSR